METKDAILSRRSIRNYTTETVEEEKINILLEAACSAPSACNRKPYEIYVVTNEEKLKLLNKSGMFTNMPSPLKIVVCGNLKKALPLAMAEYWIQDASAVVQNILIMANDLGLGACWCGAHPQKKVVKKVREILDLPEHLIPLALINIGYPVKTLDPHSGYNEKIVHFIK